MEYTQEMLCNAFWTGVLVGPFIWILLIASIKTIFNIIERIDKVLDKKNIND